jgi:hypothetical protein
MSLEQEECFDVWIPQGQVMEGGGWKREVLGKFGIDEIFIMSDRELVIFGCTGHPREYVGKGSISFGVFDKVTNCAM